MNYAHEVPEFLVVSFFFPFFYIVSRTPTNAYMYNNANISGNTVLEGIVPRVLDGRKSVFDNAALEDPSVEMTMIYNGKQDSA